LTENADYGIILLIKQILFILSVKERIIIMSLLRFVFASMIGIITIFLFINAWIFSSKKEKETEILNKKFECRFVKNVFIYLGILFLLLSFYILTLIIWLYLLIIAIIVVTVIYAITKSAKEHNKNNKIDYRRKFIGTLWSSLILVIIVIVSPIIGFHDFSTDYIIFAVIFMFPFTAQLIYYYVRWKRAE
jgi:hypothetical protein